MAIPKGLKVSINNTPQGTDDGQAWDQSIAGIQWIDVLAYDLGGNATGVFSLYSGTLPSNLADLLLPVNVHSQIIGSQTGATISIENNQVKYDFGQDEHRYDHLAQGDKLTDTFYYIVQMGNGGYSGARVDVVITGTNDAPVAVADNGTTDEDTVLVVAAENSVLANDTDVDDGDTRTVAAVNGLAGDVGHEIILPSGAKLTLNADGSGAYDPNGKFEYLSVGQSAADSFSYTVTDRHGATSTATVTITVTGAAEIPVAVDDFVTTQEDAPVTFSIVANDRDADSDLLTAANVSALSNPTLGALVDLGKG